VIGVDSADSDMIAVRARRVRGRLQFATLAAGTEALAEAVSRGDAFAVGLSCRESVVRRLEAPLASVAKARKVLPTLLDIQLPFPLEACVSEFLDCARSGEGTTRALAVATRVADAERKLESLAEHGVDPVVLDHEGLALWTQSLRDMPAEGAMRQALRAVAYLGRDRSVLVLGRGTEFLSAHAVAGRDAAAFSRYLRAHLDPAGADAGAKTVHWFWAGPGAARADVVEGLCRELSADWPGSSAVHTDPETFLARAYAVRALEPGPLRCNLRREGLAHAATERRARSRSTRAVLAALLAGLLLCAVNVGVRAAVARRRAAVDGAFQELVDRLAGYPVQEKGVHAVKTARAAAERRRVEMQPLVDAFEPSLVGLMDGLLTRAAGAGVRVEMLSLGPRTASVSGVAPDAQACGVLSVYFEEAGYDVSLVRHDPLPDKRVPFSLNSEAPRE
jgi:hypothetical protein